MPGTEIKNEQAIDTPQSKVERQKEKIRNKLDKLEKKESKFNGKLAELNKNAVETQTGIIASIRNSMDLVVGVEINKNPLETNGVTTVDSKIGLQKSFSSPDKNSTITVGGTLGVGKQFKNYIAPQTRAVSPPDAVGTGPEPGIENSSSTSTTDVIIDVTSSDNSRVPGDNTPIVVEYTSTDKNHPTPKNTSEDKKKIDINPNMYINPELYIKAKNDKGITFGTTVGGALSSNKKIAYASGSVGYETKGGLGFEATGGAKVNVNTANIIPYGGLNLYKTFGDFKINLGATTSTKDQLRVGGGITYNF